MKVVLVVSKPQYAWVNNGDALFGIRVRDSACMQEEVLIDFTLRKEKVIAAMSEIVPAWACKRTVRGVCFANSQNQMERERHLAVSRKRMISA